MYWLYYQRAHWVLWANTASATLLSLLSVPTILAPISCKIKKPQGAVLDKNIWGQCLHQIEAQSGVGDGRSAPSLADLGVWGASWAPSGVQDEAPARNAYWRILKATERSFLHMCFEFVVSHLGKGRSLGRQLPLPQPPLKIAEKCTTQFPLVTYAVQLL